MPNFAIMRSKKLSSMGSVAAALKHCYRERETPNADADRTPENELLIGRSTDQVMGALRERLPEKRRKDAVLAVEYVLTASPEWWEKATQAQQTEFFGKAMTWLAGKYGKQNIVAANIHRDEASPHLSAFVVPITADGRLSAKEFIGNKAKMTRDQTTFALAVKDLGLERGIQGSKAVHQRVQRFYAEMAQAQEVNRPIEISPAELKPQVLEKRWITSTLEDPPRIAGRLAEKAKTHYRGAVAAAAMAFQDRRKVVELQKTLSSLSAKLEQYRKLFTLDLSKEQIQKVVDFAHKLRIENRRQLELERERRKALQQERGKGPTRGF